MKLFSNSQEKGRGVLGVEMHIRLFVSDNHSLCETFLYIFTNFLNWYHTVRFILSQVKRQKDDFI
jgi:hypothetical protein